MITKKKVMISIDKKLLKKVDVVRGIVTRSAWIEDKLRRAVEEERVPTTVYGLVEVEAENPEKHRNDGGEPTKEFTVSAIGSCQIPKERVSIDDLIGAVNELLYDLGLSIEVRDVRVSKDKKILSGLKRDATVKEVLLRDSHWLRTTLKGVDGVVLNKIKQMICDPKRYPNLISISGWVVPEMREGYRDGRVSHDELLYQTICGLIARTTPEKR